MLLWAYFIELLLVHYTTQTSIETECHTNVSLPCNGDFSSKIYISVAWYKNDEKRLGIIRRHMSDNKTRLYKFPRNASFGEENSLFLPNVSPEDSGTYECDLSADVGGQNRNLFVTLNVSECATELDLTTITTVKMVLNTTVGTRTSSVQELPLMWSFIGYTAMGLTKIFLSMLTVWVINSWSRLKHRW